MYRSIPSESSNFYPYLPKEGNTNITSQSHLSIESTQGSWLTPIIVLDAPSQLQSAKDPSILPLISTNTWKALETLQKEETWERWS